MPGLRRSVHAECTPDGTATETGGRASTMNDTSYRDGRRCIRAAHVALGWVGVLVGFHIYWYLGGSFGSPERLPGWPHSLIGWAFNVLVDGAFALKIARPLGDLSRSRGRAPGPTRRNDLHLARHSPSPVPTILAPF